MPTGSAPFPWVKVWVGLSQLHAQDSRSGRDSRGLVLFQAPRAMGRIWFLKLIAQILSSAAKSWPWAPTFLRAGQRTPFRYIPVGVTACALWWLDWLGQTHSGWISPFLKSVVAQEENSTKSTGSTHSARELIVSGHTIGQNFERPRQAFCPLQPVSR